MSADVKKVWQEIEDKLFAEQDAFEQKMISLYKSDPQKAREELTRYSIDIANRSVERYWKLGDELWSKYTNSF